MDAPDSGVAVAVVIDNGVAMLGKAVTGALVGRGVTGEVVGPGVTGGKVMGANVSAIPIQPQTGATKTSVKTAVQNPEGMTPAQPAV